MIRYLIASCRLSVVCFKLKLNFFSSVWTVLCTFALTVWYFVDRTGLAFMVVFSFLLIVVVDIVQWSKYRRAAPAPYR